MACATCSAGYLQDFFCYWLSPRDRGPDPDPLREYLEGKKRFLSRGIEDVLGLIQERVKIKYDLLRQIDYDSCKMQSRLFALYHFQLGLNPNVDRMRSNIDKEQVGLEREKRMEEVACWRDLSRLRGEALLPLSGEFPINNLEADVDLGELRVPALGRVRIACRFDPPPPAPPEQIQAILQPSGGPSPVGGPSLTLDPQQAEQSLGNVPAGQYTLRLFAPGYKAEPAEVEAGIAAGQEAGPFAFTLRPEGVIMGMVLTRE